MAFLPNIQGIRVTGSLTGITSINVTGNTTLGNTTANTLTVTGNTRLASTTANTLTVTGSTTLASTTANTLTVTGSTTLASITANTLNVTGSTTLASITANTLNVTGNTTLASITANTLTVTGSTTLGNTTANTLTVTGVTRLDGVTADTLTVTGNTRLAGLTATTISAGTYSNLPNTLYTGNGSLSNNRVVDLNNNSLSFSSVTNPNALTINDYGVGVRTYASAAHGFRVGIPAGFLDTFNQGDVSTNTVGNYSFVHGANNIGTAQYSHVEGIYNTSRQPALVLQPGSMPSAGVIAIDSGLNDLSSVFTTKYIMLDDTNYDNNIGLKIFKVKNVYYDSVSTTFIILDDSSVYITNRFLIGLVGESGSDIFTSNIFGRYSHAEGTGNFSVGNWSHVEGSGSTSFGSYSHAEGYQTVSVGTYSHSEGNNTKSFGVNSHSEGKSTYALTDGSHAEGLSAFTGQYGYETEGPIVASLIILKSYYGDVTSQFDNSGNGYLIVDDTKFDNVLGIKPLVIQNVYWDGVRTKIDLKGTVNTTLPTYISPMGNSMPLYADKIIGSGYSHSEGVFTTALGYGSSSQGSGTTSIGKFSFTTGANTIADTDYLTVVGKNNTLTNDSTALFAIGNGTDSTTRSNVATFFSGQISFGAPLVLGSTLTFTSILTNNNSDTLLLSINESGVVRSYNVSNFLLLASGGTVSGATTFISGLTTNTLNVTGNTRLNAVTANTLTVTGNTRLGGVTADTLTVTGNTRLASTTANTLTVTGNTTLASITANTLTVTGNTTLASTTANTLNVTGNTTLASTTANTLTVTGNTILAGLTANTLTVTGNTRLNAVTANTLTVTGLTQTSGITSTGGITFPQKTVSSNYTATTSDYMIDVTGGTFGIYLPTAVGVQGRIYVIKNNGGGAVTVYPFGSERIDDKSFLILSETSSVQLVSNGSQFLISSQDRSTVNNSTGVFEFSGLSKVSSTQFAVAPVKGWIVDTSNPLSPQILYVSFTGGTYTDNFVTTANETYVYLTSGGTIQQQTTFVTEQQRRQNIFLGKLGHPDRTAINLVFSQPDSVLSPLSQLRDMFFPINLINGGVYPSPNGANRNFNTSAGNLYGLGINFSNNNLQPNTIVLSATSPCTFQYRTQTGGTISNTTTIDPANYDVGGALVAVGGGANSSTNQRIFLLQNGTFRVQYGQTVYSSLSDAIAGAQSETFVTFPNFVNNAILIGILSVNKNATDLSNTSQAKFLLTSKFGESVGAAGGLSTTSLQQAYNNSTNPEILTNSTLGAVTIQNGAGTADNVTNLLEGRNSLSATTSFIRADGLISANSVSATTISADTLNVTGNTRLTSVTANTLNVTGTTTVLTISATTYQNVNAVTGGTYNSVTGIITLSGTGAVNGNTITGFSTSTQFTGGTVSGGTQFISGLTANTISATTYQNLPTYISAVTETANVFTIAATTGSTNFTVDAVTGGTYNSATGIITLSGTGAVNGNTITGFGTGGQFTGGTVSGGTQFISGLTANTISATTITGSGQIAASTFRSTQSSGDEGGQIDLATAATNNTLSGGSVSIDIFQNRLRIFETGGTNRGVFIDLSTAATGVTSNLLPTWQYATSSITASTGNNYITTGTTSIALPAVAPLGGTIEVVSASDSLFTITQRAGQLIRFGIVTTTQGVGGTLVSQNNGDAIKLVCTSANTVFTVVSAVGTITLN